MLASMKQITFKKCSLFAFTVAFTLILNSGTNRLYEKMVPFFKKHFFKSFAVIWDFAQTLYFNLAHMV